MKDQVSLLLSRGINVAWLNNDLSETDKRRVESGKYSIVYGSPESWLGDTRWRKMLTFETYKNSVRVVAVDETHVICLWYVNSVLLLIAAKDCDELWKSIIKCND